MKNNYIKYIFVLLVLFFFEIKTIFAQHSKPDTIKATRIENSIKLDGQLIEPAWQQVQHISNFTQRDLDYGKPVTEHTKVAILYNKNTLYIGVWCFQKEVNKITAKNMNTDFNYRTDDNFQVMISPFNDNRTGYLFVVNPNGARADVQIYGGEDGNRDWNGVWDVKTSITDKGWFAEINIPFSTLQFKNDKILNWAINFERDIVYKNEQALWQGWSRDFSIYSAANAGRLTGIKNVAYAKKFEFKPYTLAGWQYDKEKGSTYPLKLGGNLNVSLSPTLKLNLTTFTDFAQVEADRIPVNLSRFSVYYPEKRQFFLEGSDLFNFYLGDRSNIFYSREIGIENGEQIPIIAGARLFGKIGRNNIGFLNIQEGSFDDIPATNNTVFRYKRDIGKQSYIGGIFTNRIDSRKSNQVIGFDGAYQTSKFLKNKNLTVGARFAFSAEDFKIQNNAMTYRIFADYPNDLIDNYMGIGRIEKNFNPELGYIRRTNYDSYSWYFRLSPRIFTKYGIKRLILKPWGFTLYNTHSTGEIESFSNETRPIGAIFKSGDRFEFNFIQNYDRIDEKFWLTDTDFIPVGKYMMYKYEIQFETYRARKMFTELLYNWGDFYTGKKQTFESRVGININKHLNLSLNYTINFVSLPEADITTNELTFYLDYALNPKLNFSLFSQYNDLDEIMIYNIRLHWIPKVGSDLYVVYNIGYEEPIKQIEYLKPQTTDAVVKLVYRFVF
jgi:hypothetical protein